MWLESTLVLAAQQSESDWCFLSVKEKAGRRCNLRWKFRTLLPGELDLVESELVIPVLVLPVPHSEELVPDCRGDIVHVQPELPLLSDKLPTHLFLPQRGQPVTFEQRVQQTQAEVVLIGRVCPDDAASLVRSTDLVQYERERQRKHLAPDAPRALPESLGVG